MTLVFLLTQSLIYNIGHRPDLSARSIKTAYYGTHSIKHQSALICELIPTQLKYVCLGAFKSGIRN